MMTKLKPWHKLLRFTQFRDLTSKKWEQTLELKVNVLKTTKMTLIRPPRYWLQDDCQSWLCCSAPSLHLQPWNSPLKAPVPGAAIGCWFSDRSPPSPPVASLWNKATFPFLPTLVRRELAFKRWAARPGFGNTKKVRLYLIVQWWELLPFECRGGKKENLY